MEGGGKDVLTHSSILAVAQYRAITTFIFIRTISFYLNSHDSLQTKGLLTMPFYVDKETNKLRNSITDDKAKKLASDMLQESVQAIVFMAQNAGDNEEEWKYLKSFYLACERLKITTEDGRLLEETTCNAILDAQGR